MTLLGGKSLRSTAGLRSAACEPIRTFAHVPLPRPCIASRATNSQESTSNAHPETPAAPSTPLSPPSPLPSVSGISVGGFSPTSMQGWTIVKQTLRDANVKMLSAQELVFAQSRGVPIIDVRPAELYEKGHIPGSKSVPFYQSIEGWEPMKVARRLGYALFGVLNGTEVNPNFNRDAMDLVDPKLGCILYCSIGGTLDPAEGSKKGLQSRSLIAAWQLVSSGVKNVSVMKGGYSEWVGNGRDIEMLVDEDA